MLLEHCLQFLLIRLWNFGAQTRCIKGDGRIEIGHFELGRFSLRPWNENARTKQKHKRTEIERFDWLSNGYKRAWLLVGEANAQEIDTSLWRHTATRLANRTMPSPYQGFLWRENEESMFWSFHPLSDKTNNEHFAKPFFKVMRKSLWDYFGGRQCTTL